MTEPLKDFEVQHPQEPEDEPLTEEYRSFPFGIYKSKLTSTGMLWFAAPWLFIFTKKLRCSLLELLIFVLVLGSGLGLNIGALFRMKVSIWNMLIYGALILYAHLWAFTAALYNKKRDPKIAARLPNGIYLVLFLSIPAVAFHVIGMILWRAA